MRTITFTLLVLCLAGNAFTQEIIVPPEPVSALTADSQSTPLEAVSELLKILAPKPNEILLDPGCGYDARLLITACRDFGTLRAIGVEINPDLAESARRHVKQANLSDRIEIITGDSLKLDIKADIGVAYMWPEFLASFHPKIEKLKRFVSYEFSIRNAGSNVTTKTLSNGAIIYLWKRPAKLVSIVNLPRGSYCQICGRNCNNPMAHMNLQTRPIQQASGQWVNKKVCINGQCFMQRVWQENASSDSGTVLLLRPHNNTGNAIVDSYMPSTPEIVTSPQPRYVSHNEPEVVLQTTTTAIVYSPRPLLSRPVRSLLAAKPVRTFLGRLFCRR